MSRCYVIEWYGPFTEEELNSKYSKNELKDFRFYLLSGCKKRQRTSTWQYCGITERLVTKRFKDKGHKISTILREQNIWLGKFSNKAYNRSRYNIELVEHLIISAFIIDQNDKKTKSYPKEPIGLINFWCTKNGKKRVRKLYQIQKDMSDVVIYDGDNIWYADKLSLY